MTTANFDLIRLGIEATGAAWFCYSKRTDRGCTVYIACVADRHGMVKFESASKQSPAAALANAFAEFNEFFEIPT